MNGLLQDLRYALRQLHKNPGFATVAVLTLALGISVNATMFSLVSAFLLRPPSGEDPKHVVVISSIDPKGYFLPDATAVSVPNYLAWRESNHIFSDVAAADEDRTVNLAAQGRPEVLHSAAVSFNYFSLLGVSPQLGRSFVAGEDQPGRDHVVILSHDLWDRRFNSDSTILRHTMRLNRENFTVIGVMPADFHLLGFTPQLWTPLVFNVADRTAAARKFHSLRVFARLKPGATLSDARLELAALARNGEAEFPDLEKGWGAAVRTLPDFLIYSFGIRSGLLVVMTTVGFVLMIACANVGGLLLTRAVGRQREISLRISLGASRLRIIRQMLSEGLLIALLGGSAGLLFAYWGVNFLRANLVFNEAFRAVPISLDRSVLFFTFAASLASAFLSAFLPALKSSNSDINSTLKDESRAASAGRSNSRLRSVLVTSEIAMALFLLIGTGLLIRGVLVVEHQDLGFRADHLLTTAITLDNAQYKNAPQQTRFARELLTRLRGLPAVDSVAATSDLPATGAANVTLSIQGQQDLPSGQRISALHVVVTPDYFRSAGIPILRGRAFTDADNALAPRAVLVNQEFVRRHFQGEEALGKQVRLDSNTVGSDEANAPLRDWSEIVGVVGNVKSYSEDAREEPEVYESFFQRPVPSFSLMLRTKSDPDALSSDLRTSVSRIDAELPLGKVMSMSAVIDFQRSGNPFFTRILGSFAVMALLLAAIGIYGMIAYSVGLRTREIGIRMALGARDSDVLRMILREGAKTTALGALIGLALALPLPKAFDAMFYTLRFREPALYFIVPVLTFIVTTAATYIPARHAAKVDPMVALRYE
jgi:putative ABC transport system permease protein